MADVSGHLSPPPVSPPLHRDSWYPYSNGGSHFNSGIAVILIFVFSAVICALAINTAIRFFLRSADQQPPPPNQDDGGKVTNSSDPSSLLVFPTLVFSSESKTKLAGGGECAICLSEFTEGERVSILPKCKHGFHEKCIQGWLFSHVSCPTCRTACKDNEDDQYDVEAPPPPPPQPAAAAEVIRDRAHSGE